MRINSIIFLLMCSGLSACSIIQRSSDSGYADSNEQGPSTIEDFYRERRGEQWRGAREELGIATNRELTEQEANAIRMRVELNRLEKNLEQDQERKQYYTLRPYFRTDAERIYFLRLPDHETRQRWANMKGLTAEDPSKDVKVAELIENNDIGKGMFKDAVRQSWGEPDFVEVAGNPMYGNERWRYNKLVSTEDGYKAETRIIYFEAGRVAGWETQ